MLFFLSCPVDAGDHSGEMGCGDEEEHRGRGLDPAGQVTNYRRGSSAPWRPGGSDRESGGQDHKTGQSQAVKGPVATLGCS